MILDTEEPPPLTAGKRRRYAFWSRARGLRIGLSLTFMVLALVLCALLGITVWSFAAFAVALALLVETLLQSLPDVLTTAGAVVLGIFGGVSLSQLVAPATRQVPGLEPLFTGMVLAGIVAACVGTVLREPMRAEAASYQDWLLAERRAAEGSRQEVVVDQDAVVVREETSVTWSVMGVRRTTEVRRCSRLPRVPGHRAQPAGGAGRSRR